MSNGFFKKMGQTTADAARKSAKQMVREPVEILKNVAPPHLRENKEIDNSSLVADMITGSDKNPETNFNEGDINAKDKKRLEELENEIEKIRQERKRKEEEWRKSQEDLMNAEKPTQKQFVEPQGKKRQGFKGFMKKKQGTKEMVKQVSG